MGARLYLPTLGRFGQVDPVEGGTDNSYVYPGDPVNDFDLDGTWNPKKFIKDHWRGIAQVGIVTAAVAAGAICTVATAGGCGPVAVAAIGAVSGAASNLVGQVGTGRNFNVGSFVFDTALGGALGAGEGVAGRFLARNSVSIAIRRAGADHWWPNSKGIGGKGWYKHVEVNIKVTRRATGKVVRFIHKQFKYGRAYLLKYGRGGRL